MDHLFKQSLIHELVKYNGRLLLIALLLAVTSLLWMIKMSKKEKVVINSQP